MAGESPRQLCAEEARLGLGRFYYLWALGSFWLAGHLGWLHNSRTGLSRVSVASFDNRRDLANCPAGQSPLPLGRLLRGRSGAELVEFYCHLGQSGCETFG